MGTLRIKQTQDLQASLTGVGQTVAETVSRPQRFGISSGPQERNSKPSLYLVTCEEAALLYPPQQRGSLGGGPTHCAL